MVLKELNKESNYTLLGVDGGATSTIIPLAALSALSQPMMTRLNDAYSVGAQQAIASEMGSQIPEDVANASNSQHLQTVNSFNKTTQNQIAIALANASSMLGDDGDDLDVALKLYAAITLIRSTFNNLRNNRKRLIQDSAVLGAYNAGMHDAGLEYSRKSGQPLYKTWNSLDDGKTREAHTLMDGQKVLVTESFSAGPQKIRFPRDPLAPPSLSINCRCFMTFSK